MIKTRIAGTAALFTFGLAAIGGTALTIATPAYADTGAAGSTSSSGGSSKPSPSGSTGQKPGLGASMPNSPHIGSIYINQLSQLPNSVF